MDMKSYIELGEKKAGKQAELAKILGISENYIRVTKAGRNGLPNAICFKLAEYIGVDVGSVIAASDLVTEKKEDRRKIYESYLSKTANFTVATLFIGIILIMKPSTANASWTTVSSSSFMEDFILCQIVDVETIENKGVDSVTADN